MRQWQMVYERPPLHTDALLFLVALLAHLPMALIHLPAPQKPTKDKPFSKLVNIDIIEQRIEERKKERAVLPPKVPDAKKIEEVVKRAEEVRKKLLAKAAPPPPAPPKPKVDQPKLQTPEAAKLEERLKKDIPDPAKLLQGKKAFQTKDLAAAPPSAAPQIKAGAAAAALDAASRLNAAGGPAGGTLTGKSGFQVASAAMPVSIGGDPGGGIKVGGGAPVVVVPVGKRGMADSSVLSTQVRDKGSLKGDGPAIGVPGGSGSGPGLAVGGGGAGAIAVGGGRAAGPVGGGVSATVTSKQGFPSKDVVATVAPGALSSLPTVEPIARKRPAESRPAFQITGPLANRKVLSRALPEYPEWARRKGVEAAVVLQFTVSPEGNVLDNIRVVRTTGYPEMDKLAMDALRKWKFAPLPPDNYRDEVGNITINFTVR